ncbi:MAG: sigma-70 family RNA polymerase sigma factor [Phycisphaera sp.]|nr:sigma-70 family RNA polymerase sigma factor [Phycisphaera sp.]
MTAFPLPTSSSPRLLDLLAALGTGRAASGGKRQADSGTFPGNTPGRTRVTEKPVTESTTESDFRNDPRSDEELLVAYRTGETGAFNALVERYRNDLVQFLQRFLGSRAAADDVFQDAFLQIHLSAESFDASRRFKPWLYTIAANKARDFHRRRRRRAAVSLSAPVGSADGRETTLVDLLDGGDADIDSTLLDEEKQRLVKQVVDDLPVHYREILLLSYFQKLSYNQISDSLQIPLGTVKSRLHSAVAHFADSWKAASTRHQRRRGDGGTAA